MKKLGFILILLISFCCQAQQPADIWFTTDPGTNWSNMVQIWRGAGSSYYSSQKCPEFIFDAVEDIGLDNTGTSNNANAFQSFIDNFLFDNDNPKFKNKLIMIYFPAGTYRFNHHIDFDKRPLLIIKGAGADNTRFDFFTDSVDFKVVKNNIGFEDFMIKRGWLGGLGPEGRDNESYTFHFEDVSNCWISGVRSEYTYAGHVFLYNCRNTTITGSYFDNARRHWGGTGYGVKIGSNTESCLVENNYFNFLRHGIVLQENCFHNVIGYNAIHNSHDLLGTWHEFPDLELHGRLNDNTGPNNNLIEGNRFDWANIDFFDNSVTGRHRENGPYNTFMRNHIEKIDVNGYDPVGLACAEPTWQFIQNFILSDPKDGWGNSWACSDILHIPFTDTTDHILTYHNSHIEDHPWDDYNFVSSYYKTTTPNFQYLWGNYPFYRDKWTAADNRAQNWVKEQDENWGNYCCEPFFAKQVLFPNFDPNQTKTINSSNQVIIRAADSIKMGNCTVTGGSHVNFIAGSLIALTTGFSVTPGCTFNGYLGGCSTPAIRLGHTTNDHTPELTSLPLPPSKTIATFGNPTFEVYPNPNTGSFTLQLKDLAESDVQQLIIMDINGNKIQSNQYRDSEGIHISLSNEVKGLYLVALKTISGLSIIKKVSVN
jgi:hypothetical protein